MKEQQDQYDNPKKPNKNNGKLVLENEPIKQQKRRGTVTFKDSDGPPEHLYTPQSSILTIGDGDLSFSASIAQWLQYRYKSNAGKFVATTYDSYEELVKLYHWSVKNNIERLKKRGVKVYHEIDVNKLLEFKEALDPQNQKFDRVVWNFPHAGFPEVRIGPGFEWEQGFHKKHTEILDTFFRYAKAYLKAHGKVLMAHKTVEPFSIWNIRGIAQNNGYKLIESFPFRIEQYPGYENRRGAGKNGGKRFPIEDAIQYVFGL